MCSLRIGNTLIDQPPEEVKLEVTDQSLTLSFKPSDSCLIHNAQVIRYSIKYRTMAQDSWSSLDEKADDKQEIHYRIGWLRQGIDIAVSVAAVYNLPNFDQACYSVYSSQRKRKVCINGGGMYSVHSFCSSNLQPISLESEHPLKQTCNQ